LTTKTGRKFEQANQPKSHEKEKPTSKKPILLARCKNRGFEPPQEPRTSGETWILNPGMLAKTVTPKRAPGAGNRASKMSQRKKLYRSRGLRRDLNLRAGVLAREITKSKIDKRSSADQKLQVGRNLKGNQIWRAEKSIRPWRCLHGLETELRKRKRQRQNELREWVREEELRSGARATNTQQKNKNKLFIALQQDYNRFIDVAVLPLLLNY
jgi:hypothetical protein